MKNEQKRSSLPNLMVLLVFGSFAVCILLVLLTGGDLYRQLTQRHRDNFDKRTVCQYIATRVRQADRADAVTVEDFCGREALVIREEVGEKTYLTRIYCWDGALMELFTPETGQFSPEDGETLLAAADLDFALEDDTLQIRVDFADSTGRQLTLLLRSYGGAL